jgi:hypothetical protein
MKKIVVALLLSFAAVSLPAAEAPHPTLARLVGEFEATVEQPDHTTGEWKSRSMTLTGRRLLDGHYVELRGVFTIEGFKEPISMALIWSFDPLQKEFRVAVFDNLIGLLDVFEQESADPLTLSNVSHGTYFASSNHGKSYSRIAVNWGEGDETRMEFAGSFDEGKSWRPYARLKLRRR